MSSYDIAAYIWPSYHYEPRLAHWWTEKDGVRSPMVSHTINPVPLVIKDYTGTKRFELRDLPQRGLANVAATLCLLLGFEPPSDFEPPLIAPIS